MRTPLLFGFLAMFTFGLVAPAAAQEKSPPKKSPAPFVMETLKKSPDAFLKQFDKNKDGFLDKDELPPFLARTFEKFDRNGDGLLNREETSALVMTARQFLAAQSANPAADPDTLVNVLLKQFDTDQDGKISKKEATGRLADDFARSDKNKDGFLDRDELRTRVRLLQELKAGPGGKGIGGFGGPPDFDALDQDADGRLSKYELQGTRWAPLLTEIDSGGDGQIDRREFETYLRKTAEKR